MDSAKVQSSIDEFKSVVTAQASDPHVVAELMLLALVVFQRDEDLARAMSSLLVEPDDVTKDAKSPSGLTVVRSVADDMARNRGARRADQPRRRGRRSIPRSRQPLNPPPDIRSSIRRLA